jgi:hypothetical protein
MKVCIFQLVVGNCDCKYEIEHKLAMSTTLLSGKPETCLKHKQTPYERIGML